jgi:anti-sigma-K factor RskA
MSDDAQHDDDITPDRYADLASLSRSLTAEDRTLDEPPAGLWASIAAEVAALEQEPAAGAPSVVTDLGAVRAARSPARWFAVAAAVLAVVVAGVVLFIDRDDDTTTVAQVALVYDDGFDPRGAASQGEASLVRLDDGRYALDVDVSDLPATDGEFLELWVIDENVEGMVSLGPLDGDGRFVLPATVDPDQFPVVDISIEPVDGVPTHSGASILRGVLAT